MAWTLGTNGRETDVEEMGYAQVDGRKRRGRQGIIWEDCLKRALTGLGGKWRTRARDKREWRRVVETAVKREQCRKEKETRIEDQYRCQPHPDSKHTEESNVLSVQFVLL